MRRIISHLDSDSHLYAGTGFQVAALDTQMSRIISHLDSDSHLYTGTGFQVAALDT